MLILTTQYKVPNRTSTTRDCTNSNTYIGTMYSCYKIMCRSWHARLGTQSITQKDNDGDQALDVIIFYHNNKETGKEASWFY